MTTLVIVESPAKGKKIEEYLGQGYKVMATKGHIADLANTGQYNLGVNIENNFKPTYKVLPDKIELLQNIIDEASVSDCVWMCSDGDREGEAIAWHLASKLSKLGKEIKRIEFHEITKKGIADGIKKSRELDINIFHAQEARRILDRIVGFMASPFLMSFFGNNLSSGRVQSVVTKIVVDREQEIDVFVPETYFTIKANLSKDGKDAFLAKLDEKITDENRANERRVQLDKKDNVFEVSSVDADEEIKRPNPPMITSQLQKVMSKAHGINPDATMKAAQSLYENGYVTYIRTDSVRSDPDAIKALRDYLVSNGHSVPKTEQIFKTKDSAQDAHECIRPTDLNMDPDSSGLSGDEQKVYDTIWRYFVSSQMESAIYNTLKVSIKLRGDDKCILKASGKALKSKGFLEVAGGGDDSKIEIPSLSEGDELSLKGKKAIVFEKKQTQPPARFTNYSLIEILEKKNIGRPATFSEVLSKISNRNYVELDGNTFKPTPLGIQVTEALTKFFNFMEYNYTAELEKKLDEIEAGKQNHITMLKEFYGPFKEELDRAYIFNGSEVCDKCKSPMKIRQAKSGGDKFLGCSSFPKCYNTKPILKQDAVV